MLDLHQAGLQSDTRHAIVIMHAFLRCDVYTVLTSQDDKICASRSRMQSAKHTWRSSIQMSRQFAAKHLHATLLEAVSAALQQAAVNKVSADTVYLELLLQGTVLLHHSSHLLLAIHDSCLTCLALHLILLLHRPLKKLTNVLLLCTATKAAIVKKDMQ